MNFKNIAVIFFISSAFFWYTLVYSSFYRNDEVQYFWVLSKNIYLSSKSLDQTLIIFDSKNNISDYKIHSNCEVKTEFLYVRDTKYFFHLKFLNSSCNNHNFYLKDEKGSILTNTHFQLNIISDFVLYKQFTDYQDRLLVQVQERILTQLQKWRLFASVDMSNPNFDFVKKSRYYSELEYIHEKIDEIVEKRKLKYQIPIVWYQLPDGRNLSKLPNSARPYRANYTNAIHEGWDIDAPAGTRVISIDDGIILRIVDNFQFSDLGKMKRNDDITQTDKIMNLDILRWNQVWVKTMKGDVIFYSHLDAVNPDIQVGKTIKRGQFIGTVGITGVPDKNYTDYHLHFELRKNPYNHAKAGKNTHFDYMNWDWYFKGKDSRYILENQYKIFER